jgi:hypothetical protein
MHHAQLAPFKRFAREVIATVRGAGSYLPTLVQRRKSRIQQRRFLDSEALPEKARVVVFFVYAGSRVTGGRLQIFTLHRMSRDLFAGTDTTAVMCWLPGQGRDHCRITSHTNDVTICRFSDVVRRCRPECELMLHVPEFIAGKFCDDLVGWKWIRDRARVSPVHINVLNQNMDRMVNRSLLQQLQNTGTLVTITAGAKEWANPQDQSRMGVPIHWLSTWYYPDDAAWQPFETKQNLMIVSPDSNIHRESVLSALRRELPNLELKVISGVPYDEYTTLERTAKWSLTFGEGCDGYFYGTALRGGVPFAVKNYTFQGLECDDWMTLFDSYDDMATNIASVIRQLDSKLAYEQYSLKIRPVFAKDRGVEILRDQLRRFYIATGCLPG